MTRRRSVLLYGPPLAGKSTILECFAQRESLDAESFEIKPAGQAFAERGYRVVDDRSVVAATAPGAVWTMGTWDELLRKTKRILLVLDPQKSRREANLEYIEYLGDYGRRVVGIQVTKTDLVEREAAQQVAGEITRKYSLNVPISYSTICDRSSVSAFVARLTAEDD